MKFPNYIYICKARKKMIPKERNLGSFAYISGRVVQK